jgi:hypothetical protein
MPRLTTIYWRDIPAQVIGQQGRKRIKQVLDPRFALAIDRAAMRAGKGSSDLYLEEWQRKSRAVEGDLDELVQQEVARLEALFPEEVLEAVTKAGGKHTATT